MATSASLGRVRPDCPVCAAPDLQYEFIIDGYPACGCQRCGLLFLNPQPGTDTPAAAASIGGGPSATATTDVEETAAHGACTALARLLAYAHLTTGRLLLVNATPQMEADARARGF